ALTKIKVCLRRKNVRNATSKHNIGYQPQQNKTHQYRYVGYCTDEFTVIAKFHRIRQGGHRYRQNQTEQNSVFEHVCNGKKNKQNRPGYYSNPIPKANSLPNSLVRSFLKETIQKNHKQ